MISTDVFEAVGVCPVQCIGVAARIAAPLLRRSAFLTSTWRARSGLLHDRKEAYPYRPAEPHHLDTPGGQQEIPRPSAFRPGSLAAIVAAADCPGCSGAARR